MTEPNDPTATGYVPISCDLHSEYELAILRRQWLRLVWVDDNFAGSEIGRPQAARRARVKEVARHNVIHDEVVLPLDLKTVRHDDSRDGGRSGPSWPLRGITPSLEGRGRAASGDGRDAGGREAVAGTAVEEFLVCRAKDDTAHEIRLDYVRQMETA